MPEYEKRAKADLAKLAAIDDSKITVDQGTAEAPKIVQINNPLPTWKRIGFKDQAELSKTVEGFVKKEPAENLGK
jgi:hypothetical protein